MYHCVVGGITDKCASVFRPTLGRLTTRGVIRVARLAAGQDCAGRVDHLMLGNEYYSSGEKKKHK